MQSLSLSSPWCTKEVLLFELFLLLTNADHRSDSLQCSVFTD